MKAPGKSLLLLFIGVVNIFISLRSDLWTTAVMDAMAGGGCGGGERAVGPL